jgi:hypothetical protein
MENMSQKEKEFITELATRFAGKWVALSKNHDAIVESSDDLSELALKVKGRKDLVFTKVLEKDHVYAF